METLGVIALGAIPGLGVAIYALIRGWGKSDAITKANAARHEAEKLGAALTQQLIDRASEIKAQDTKIAALKLFDRTGTHDRLVRAWFLFTLKLLTARDRPGAELVANAFERGLHPDDLRDANDQDPDDEPRPATTGVPLVLELASTGPSDEDAVG